MKRIIEKNLLTLLIVLGPFHIMAQETDIVGMWQILNTDGTPGKYGKIFMPDGKLYGYRLEGNDSTMKTWIMGRYRVTSHNKYSENIEYHIDMQYMGQLDFNYSIDSKRELLTTDYTFYGFDGKPIPSVFEKWGRRALADDLLKDINENWDKLLSEAREASYYSIPNDTLRNSMADLLFKNVMESKEKGPAQASMLMLRAEMDTTNIDWLKDVVEYISFLNMAPSIGEKYTRRLIELSKTKATMSTDTSIVKALGYHGLLFLNQGRTDESKKIIRQAISLEEKSGRPANMRRGLLYMYLCGASMNEGNASMAYQNACNATEIFEKSTDTPSCQKAIAYEAKAVAKFLQGDATTCLQHLEESIPLFVGEEGKAELEGSVFPMAFGCYGLLCKENPKDKNVRHRYQKFMEDKLLLAIKTQYSSDTCYIFEIDDWNMNSPYAFDIIRENMKSLLICRGDKFYIKEVVPEGGKESENAIHIVVVEKTEKKRMMKLWKQYRKESVDGIK